MRIYCLVLTAVLISKLFAAHDLVVYRGLDAADSGSKEVSGEMAREFYQRLHRHSSAESGVEVIFGKRLNGETGFKKEGEIEEVWHSLGRSDFEAEKLGSVQISDEGEDGCVVIDDVPSPPVAPKKGEFYPLFNGRDLSGWWGCGTEDPAKWMALAEEELAAKKKKNLVDVAKHWKVVDGDLVNDGSGLYLTTERNFKDFELRLEYKHGKGADSGIYLRGIPQVQIWDPKGKHPDARKGSGGLWNNRVGTRGRDPLIPADKPAGQWNTIMVRMIGNKVTVILNDKIVVKEAPLQNFFNKGGPLPESGPIQLQTHGAEMIWRNIQIKEL